MNKLRYSGNSESEESDSSIGTHAVISKSLKKKISSSSDLSDSSSDSEDQQPPPPDSSRKLSISPKKTVTTSLLDKFVENAHLKQLKVEDVITNDDDVCMIEIPKTFDVSHLIGRVIHFDRKTKVKVNKTKYVIEPSVDEVKTLNILTKNLKIFHPVASFKMHENTKIKSSSEATEVEKFTPTLPENLKSRHPLFGADFERIEEKLNVSVEKALKKMKKKKKRHELENTQESFHDEQSVPSEKKKKKSKRKDNSNVQTNFPVKTEVVGAEEQELSNVQESIFALLETHVQNKKKKHKNDVKEEFSSKEDTEPQYAEVKKRHKNKIKDEVQSLDEVESSCKSNSGEEKKLKRKNKIKQEKVDSEEMESFLGEHSFVGDNGFQNLSFDRKGHKKDFKNSESFDVSGNKNDEEEGTRGMDEDRKRKKKRHNSVKIEIDGNSFEGQDTPNHVNNGSAKKKKHKYQIKEENSSLKNEIEVELNQIKKRDSSCRNDTSADINGSYVGSSFNETKEGIKPKKNNIINSTVIQGLQLPLFEFDVSGIMNKEEAGAGTPHEHKKKKKKEETPNYSGNGNLEGTEEGLTEDRSHHDVSKKRKNEENEASNSSPKKKRKKSEQKDENVGATDALISSLLSKIKSELGSSAKQKKKKHLET